MQVCTTITAYCVWPWHRHRDWVWLCSQHMYFSLGEIARNKDVGERSVGSGLCSDGTNTHPDSQPPHPSVLPSHQLTSTSGETL